jgi:phage tail protein X
MADAYEEVTVRSYGMTVRKIVWRRFRKPMPGLAERVLDFNPGLAALGFELPVGTTFTLIIPEEPQAPSRPVTRLWGASA